MIRSLPLRLALPLLLSLASLRAFSAPATAPAAHPDAAFLVDRAIEFANQIKDPAKRERQLFIAADTYLAIGREADANLIAKSLTEKDRRQFENSRMLRQLANTPEEALKAIAAEPDLENRTQLYTLLRGKLLPSENIELIKHTLGDDQRDYPRDLGLEHLATIYLQRGQFDEASNCAATIKNAPLKENANSLINVARVLASGKEDPYVASETRDLDEEKLDRALGKIVQYRSKKADFKSAYGAFKFMKRPKDKAFAIIWIALAQHQAGKKPEALATIAEAEKLIPEIEVMYRDLARNSCLLALIDIEPQKAIDEVRAMDKESQSNFSPMLNNALIKLGKPDEAIASFLADEDRDFIAMQMIPLLARYGYFNRIDEILKASTSLETKGLSCLIAAQTILAAEAATCPAAH